MYKHVKMTKLQIQKIENISHITCSKACYPLVERVKKIINVNRFQQRDKGLCMMGKEKHVNL